ncbi:MAG: S1 RNA-binding domain-containing protein [Pirellula sp.]|jgi:transcriptional accessory protein Tex/SPT6
MKNLQEIARRVRRPEDQLRFPCELIQQGYEPNYLANYRPDELGGLDELTLSMVKRAVKQLDSIDEYKAKILASLEKDPHAPATAKEIVQNASSIAQIDTTMRHIRSRKNAKSIAEQFPAAVVVGQAILTLQGEAPADLSAWVAQTAGVPAEQAEEVLAQTKNWLTHLLGEDLRLMVDLQQYVLSRGSVSVKILPEPAKGSQAEKELEANEDSDQSGTAADVSGLMPVQSDATTTSSDANTDEPAAGVATSIDDTQPSSEPETSTTSEPSAPTEIAPTEPALTATDEAVAPLIAEFNQGKKSSKPLKTKSLSDKQLSPRQRRRRWIRSILESYAKLKKQVGNLTPYQILMITRGLRSQIIQLHFQYDRKPLIQKCREALCPGRHPMHGFLLQLAESALDTFLLPRVHQDVMAILEEFANEELTEAAVGHLQGIMLQRPIRGHRIMIIDALGPKMAAVAIVDANGEVLFTGEIPCNSNRADIVAQSVVSLGTWVHEHKVTLISLSNGPARRYLTQPIAELLKQSNEGSLYWAMVDRAGADAYCSSRICLVELPNISRRHRAAVWLARRLQDPLRQILKVEPTRLRLGSYHREIPQNELEVALRDAVSSAISKSGLDIFQTEPEVLQRAPGMTLQAAKAVAKACQEGRITNRDSLMTVLKENLSETQARQAIGFLRVFGSEVTYDATTIHPDDYRLAQRLVEHASLPVPPSHPDGWVKPDYSKLAEANAAADKKLEDQQAAFGVMPEAESHEEVPLDGDGELGDSPIEENTIEVASSETVAPDVADTVESGSVETAESDASGIEPETVVEAAATATSEETAGNTDASLPATSSEGISHMPPIATEPLQQTPLSIDAERLARSWQVGREKLRRVAHALQFPFADDRDFRYPVPLISKMPRLDSLKPGDMLQALVLSVTDFGVFVELGPECNGLIHISRLSNKFLEDPHQYVQAGDLMNVWVVNIDEKKKRVALSAIPPGSQTAREPREERDGESRRSGRPTGRGTPARSESGTASSGNRPAGAGSRESADRNDRSGGGNRGSFGGRNDRSRNDRNDRGRPGRGRNENSGDDRRENRRPARVEPPKPVVPITEAMQQGKEPLRSFSDLMQFMKKSKTEPEIVPETNPAPVADQKEPVETKEMAAQNSDDTPSGPVA